ncbi:cytochrome c oxidase assembly factor Coa1 family protein [Polaromonas sp. CT11-55]|uniref:cytochrome c oxidase assembly factor Coa1 family protein n=1 Tax=Polaromonas sp. CT11-55 TaxID=3243045 RepID=UPI0039A4F343
MENTSGQGAAATVPADIDKWNWGAFLLNWIWGIGNNTFIALLMFVPFVNVVMIFILGAKGSSWAWRNKRWDSVDQFKAMQRRWAKWGVAVWVGAILGCVALFFTIAASFKSSEAFKLAMVKLGADEQVSQLIGKPMSAGMPMGSIEVSGPRGSASLSFTVEGPKGKGTAYVEAVKDLGQWKIERMAFEQEGTGRRIDLAQ